MTDGVAKNCYPITPYLTVADARKSLDFYQRAFGFEPGTIMETPDGDPAHCDMTFNGMCIIMFSPEGVWGDTEFHTPVHSGVSEPINLYVYCPDVDAMVAQAVDAGATMITEPEDMFWGDRISQVRDPDGYRWTFATNLRDFDPEKDKLDFFE